MSLVIIIFITILNIIMKYFRHFLILKLCQLFIVAVFPCHPGYTMPDHVFFHIYEPLTVGPHVQKRTIPLGKFLLFLVGSFHWCDLGT